RAPQNTCTTAASANSSQRNHGCISRPSTHSPMISGAVHASPTTTLNRHPASGDQSRFVFDFNSAGATAFASYPASFTAASTALTSGFVPQRTNARPPSRFTDTPDTPATPRIASVTCRAQLPHVIPLTANSVASPQGSRHADACVIMIVRSAAPIVSDLPHPVHLTRQPCLLPRRGEKVRMNGSFSELPRLTHSPIIAR